MTRVQVLSFGYGHAPAPQADITIDTRRHLRNPHHDQAMRQLTGLDRPVRSHVLTTPGAPAIVRHTIACVRDLLADLGNDPGTTLTVAVGCVGGRHRSVAIAEEIAAGLRQRGISVQIEHRDVAKPVIARSELTRKENCYG